MLQPQVNTYLFQRLSDEGKEIRFIKRHKKIIGALIVEPLRKLQEKGIISPDQYSAGMRYCQDYARSFITHHARPSYDGTPISSHCSKPGEKTISQSQLRSSENVRLIKEILEANSPLKVRRKVLGDKKYLLLVNIILERQMSLNVAHKITGWHYDTVEKRMKEILDYMARFYE